MWWLGRNGRKRDVVRGAPLQEVNGWPPGWQGGMRGSGWLIAAMQGRQVICTWVLFFSLLSWGAATGNCQSYGQPIRMVDRAAELAGCVQAQENSAMKGECKKL